MNSILNPIVRAYWELQGYIVLTMSTDKHIIYNAKKFNPLIQFRIAEYNRNMNITIYFFLDKFLLTEIYTEEQILQFPEMIKIAKLKAFM